MPRGQLNEKHVQQVSVEWLVSYYRGKVGVEAVSAEREAGVRKHSDLGRGRADGLVAWLASDGTIGTAALEAKSSRTLSHITFRYLDGRLLLHALAAGVVGLLLAGFGGWLIGAWFWMWVFPIIVFFAIGLAHLLLAQEYSRYRATSVVHQVKRYPANEQWISVSTDAYNRLYPQERDALQAECKKEGIGLLRVSPGRSPELIEAPRPRNMPKGQGDFLSCYARSETIRQKLRIEVESNNYKQN